MKILIIPDVHGRDFWVEPCSHIDEFDKVIFLGDYHDPYPQQVSQDTSRHRLRDELVPFVEANKDKVICLLGNHDLQYFRRDFVSRGDEWHWKEILEYLNRLNLRLIYKIDDYLFSHSGVLPLWVSDNELDYNKLDEVPFDDTSLMCVSPYRGGWNSCGSCVWGDVREYDMAYHYAEFYQIFGHTQMQYPIINKDYACLDCRKAFVLDTETKELKEYDYEK